MPVQPPSGNILDHWDEMVKIFGPLVAVIVGLITWAWHKMAKDNDDNFTALEKHEVEDQRIHDIIFNQLREEESKRGKLAEDHAKLQGRFDALMVEHNREMDKE